jgi:hypothetical protein
VALLNVQHKPVTGKARQFDGTVQAFLDILGARSSANVEATCGFDSAGNFVRLTLTGGAIGSVVLGVGDWVVFPTDATQPAFAVSNALAVAEWAVV